jgi:uncharacterized protein YfaS (alpha-2-macroglobulin family)
MMIEHEKLHIVSEFVKDKMKINLSINKEGKHNETYWVTNFLKLLSGFFLTQKTIKMKTKERNKLENFQNGFDTCFWNHC